MLIIMFFILFFYYYYFFNHHYVVSDRGSKSFSKPSSIFNTSCISLHGSRLPAMTIGSPPLSTPNAVTEDIWYSTLVVNFFFNIKQDKNNKKDHYKPTEQDPRFFFLIKKNILMNQLKTERFKYQRAADPEVKIIIHLKTTSPIQPKIYSRPTI